MMGRAGATFGIMGPPGMDWQNSQSDFGIQSVGKEVHKGFGKRER